MKPHRKAWVRFCNLHFVDAKLGQETCVTPPSQGRRLSLNQVCQIPKWRREVLWEVEEKLREGGGQAAAGELGHSRSAPGRTGVGGHARPAHAGTARVFSEARRSRGRTGKTQDFVWSPPVPAKSKACGEERQGSSASLRWRVSENAEHVR